MVYLTFLQNLLQDISILFTGDHNENMSESQLDSVTQYRVLFQLQTNYNILILSQKVAFPVPKYQLKLSVRFRFH